MPELVIFRSRRRIEELSQEAEPRYTRRISDQITTAFYEAKLSDSNSVEQWEEQGSKDAARRAYERWNQLLADYEAPPLDAARREALDDYVARRKTELPDAWY